jgi:phage terminase large subunit-like protein
MKDYCAIAIEYAKAAIADKKHKRHGRWIRLAAQRFIDDLKRAEKNGCAFKFDKWHGDNACDFIEKLPHVEGKWDSPTIVLHPAQCFFIVQLFGFRDKKTENRRFTSALYATARKSGKSTISAAILLYCSCCEDEPGAQIISAATTFPQAAIIFNIAKMMVDKTPDLREAFGLETWAKAITRYETGSSIKPIHAKASTQDGLNPSHTALDEIHAHKTPDLLNVLTSAAGARENPLWLYTTTEGYTSPGPWGELRDFAKKLLLGVFGNDVDHFLAMFWAVDEEDKAAGIKADDDFDEAKWVKANPLIDINPHLLSAIRKEAVEAKQMPSKLAEFKIKRLNRQASTAGGWIDLLKWRLCSGKVDLDLLKDVPCYGALDLASTSDLASLRLVWELSGMFYTHGWRWCPEEAVKFRTERGTVPYASWVNTGLIKQTEGNVTDYEVIEDDIKGIFNTFKVKMLAYDPWNAYELAQTLKKWLIEEKKIVEKYVPLNEFIQGTKSYHPAMKKLENIYISGKLRHGGDPVLNWCASNIVARRDMNLNMAPDKKKSADKIDDMTALLMAVGVMIGNEEEKSVYDGMTAEDIVKRMAL